MNATQHKLNKRDSTFIPVQAIVLSRVLNGMFQRLDELEYRHTLLSHELEILRKRKGIMFETSE